MRAEELLHQAFRLSRYEARIYLALLKGSRDPKELAASARVPYPRVYDTLHSLADKGFIEEANGRYEALPPEVALRGRLAQFMNEFRREMEEKEEALDRLVKELKGMGRARAEEPGVSVLKGIKVIANRFLQVLSECDEVLVAMNKGLRAKDLFKQYLEVAKGRRGKILALIPKDARLSEEDLAFAKEVGMDIRSSYEVLLDVMVGGNKDVIIGVPDPTGEEEYGAIAVWIRNEAFARGVKEAFMKAWEAGETYRGQAKG